MSIKAMSWVFEQTELAGNEKLVLLSLADHCCDDGLAWPSVERIALKSSVSKRTAQRILKSLEDTGWLSRKEGSRHETTRYQLVFSRGANLSPLNIKGCQIEHLGVTPGASRGDIAVSPKPSITIIEPSTICAFEKDFEDWWKDEYPARKGTQGSKPQSKAIYIRNRKAGVTKEQISKATQEYFDELWEADRVGTEFVKQTTTWLNGKFWEND